MSNITEAIVTILTAIIGVAILAVIVSRNSNTTGVIQSAGSAFSSALGTAVSPITGSSFSGVGSSIGLGQFGG